MSLLLDALKKAAEQKAKKSQQETPGASPVDEADDEDEFGLEALLERSSESTQTEVGEPKMPLDDDQLSISVSADDATNVRDPESLARAALGDDTRIHQPAEFAETRIEDQTEVKETSEFAETMVVDDRSEFTDTGEFAKTLLDQDRSEFTDSGKFDSTMVDEDRSEFAETGKFDSTTQDRDRGEFTGTGELDKTMVDEDRSEFADTGQFDKTMVDEDRSEFASTGQFDKTMVDEDRSEFADTGQFDQTMVDKDRSEFAKTGQFAETLAEDPTEIGETFAFSETQIEDSTEFNEITQFVELPDEDSTEIADNQDEDHTELVDATEFGEPLAEDRTESREPTEFVEPLADDSIILREPVSPREPTEFTEPSEGGNTELDAETRRGVTAETTEFTEPSEGGNTELDAETRRGVTAETTEFTEPSEGGNTELDAETRRGVTAETTEFTEPSEGGNTELDEETRRGVTAETTEYTVHFEEDDVDAEDRTEFREHGLADVTGFEASHGADDDTGITTPPQREDQTDTRAPMATLTDLERRENDDTTSVNDDDMSLLLVDDPTGVTSRSKTDPRGRDAALRILQGDQQDGLALVDTTRHQAPIDRAGGIDPGSAATTTRGLDTQTQTNDGTTRRTEQTFTSASTTTYAPDNYDRTLMRLPSGDESKLFAGMKSEGDVVMTPDYAKKVFRSKSSAQRWLHLRTYAGFAIVILIGIGFYGAFEYQGQSENIDTSLRPLKRDPMPGLIKPETSESLAGLFADPEVTERTIGIIESAEQPDSGVIAGPIETEIEGEDESPDGVVKPAAGADLPREKTVQQPAAQVAALDQAGPSQQASSVADTASTSASNLQITSNSRLAERDVWLRQAYAAYQSGDDDAAVRLYNQVLAEDPGNRNALLGRAAINVQNNNPGAALRDYQRLLEANPKDSLAMTSMLAISNLSPAETESHLKLMIRDEPDSPYLNFALANAYGAQKRWREAQGHYFIALENNPGDPNYAYNLAVSLEHIAQPNAAASYYRRALANFDKGLATFNRELVNQRMEVLENL